MADPGWARRQVLRAAVAMGLIPSVGQAAPAVAWSSVSAFATGPCEKNFLAQRFAEPERPLVWPSDPPLIGAHGPTSLSAWRGKTLLVALWAEWCAACLAEMPSLSRLNRKYAGSTFEIVPIFTGSSRLHTLAAAQRRLNSIAGVELQTLMDGSPDGGALMRRFAQLKPLPAGGKPQEGTDDNSTLPALLVVAPDGHLRGRMLGGTPPGVTPMWDLAQADSFIAALARGVA